MQDLIHTSQTDVLGLYEHFKHGLFGAMYRFKTAKGGPGNLFFYLSTGVCMVQLMYLPFSDAAQFSWPASLELVAEPGLKVFAFGFFAFESRIAFIILFTFACLCSLTCIVSIGLTTNEAMRRTTKYTGLLPWMLWILRMCQTVFLQPIVVVLLRVFRCHPVMESLVGECDGGLHLGIKIVSGITLVVFYVTIAVFALIVIEFVPQTLSGKERNHGYSAPHGRVEFVSVVIRGLVSGAVALFGTMWDTNETPSASSGNVLSGLIVLSGVTLTFGYFYYLPFHQMRLNRFAVGSWSVYLWTGVSLIVAQAVGNSRDLSSLIVLIMACPLFVFSMLAMTTHRIHALIELSKTALITNSYIVEVRLRLLHDISHRKELTDEIIQSYREAIESNPNSAYLCLVLASLIMVCERKVVFGLQLIRKAKHLPLSFDLEYFLYCHNKSNEDRQNSSSGAISFMDFDKHLKFVRTSIMQTLKLSAKFWKRVSRENHNNVSVIVNEGRLVHEAASQCQMHLKKLLKLSESNLEAMRWYAVFTSYVMNDVHTARRIMEKTVSGGSETSSGYAVCTVSGNAATMGQILDVTDACCTLFGYTRMELIGRNVSVFCPPPFDATHDNMIKHFLDSDSDFETKTRRIYGVHRNGHLLPVDFVITPSTNANSDLILIGKFTERQPPEGTHLLVVDAISKCLTSFTLAAPEAVGVSDSEIFALNVRVTDVFPDFYTPDGKINYLAESYVVANHARFRIRARPMDFSSREGDNANKYMCSVIIIMLTLVEKLDEGDVASDVGVGHSESEGEDEEEYAEHRGCEENASALQPRGCPMDMDGGGMRKPSSVPSSPPPMLGSPHVKGGMKPPPLKQLPSSSMKPGERSFRRSPMGKSSAQFSYTSHSKNNSKKMKSPGKGSPTNGGTFAGGALAGVNGFGEGMSQSSSTLDGSTMTPELQIQRIQQRIMQGVKKKDPQLQKFGKFMQRFLILFSIISIANAVVVSNQYHHFVEEIKMVEMIHGNAQIISKVSTLTLFMTQSSDVVVDGVHYDREIPHGTELLSGGLTDLKTSHQILIEDLESHFPEVFTPLLFQDNLPVNGTGNAKELSFHVFVLEFIKHAERFLNGQIAAGNASNTNSSFAMEDDCDVSCEFILTNGVYSPLDRIIDVAKEYEQTSFHSLFLVEQYGLISMCAIFGLLALSFFVGFLPMWMSQDTHRHRVARAFGSIPTSTCHKLQKKAERRYVKLQQGHIPDIHDIEDEMLELDDDEVESLADIDEDAELDDNGEEGAIMSKWVKAGNKVSPAEKVMEIANADLKKKKKQEEEEGKETAVKAAQKRRGLRARCCSFWCGPCRTIKRKLSKCHVSLHLLWSAIQIGFTFWMVLGFSIAVAYFDSENHSAVKKTSMAVHVSGLRVVLTTALTFWISHDPTTLSATKLETLSERIATINHALIYGNASMNIQPFKHSQGEQFELYFENACNMDCEGYIQSHAMEDVEAADILRYGAQLALEKYLEMVPKIANLHREILNDPTNQTLQDMLGEMRLKTKNLQPHLLLQQQLHIAMENYLDAVEFQVESITASKRVITGILVGMLLVGHIISLRAFSKMDKNLKNTKTILLMLPVEVFTQVPLMKKLLEENK